MLRNARLFQYSKRVLSLYHKDSESLKKFAHIFPQLFLPKAKPEVASWNVTEGWQVLASAYLQPFVLKDLLECITYPYSAVFTTVKVLTAGLAVTSTNSI